MNLADFPKIENLTSKKLRDIAILISRMDGFKKERLLSIFERDPEIDSNVLFDFFIENNLINLRENTKTIWEPTTILRSIAGASLAKRKSSKNAWLEVAKLIARSVVIAKHSEWSIESPCGLFVFGSLLDPNKKDYGDADLTLITSRKEDIEVLFEKQKIWLKDNADFLSSASESSFGFEDTVQLRKDICFGSNFYSLHPVYDIEFLVKENKDKVFPMMGLWSNKIDLDSAAKKETDICNTLAKKWENENVETAKRIRIQLNDALNSLGIENINTPDFENSCETYIKNSLSEELKKKLTKSNKYNRDVIETNRAFRFCKIGKEAIRDALKEIELQHLQDSKLIYSLKNF